LLSIFNRLKKKIYRNSRSRLTAFNRVLGLDYKFLQRYDQTLKRGKTDLLCYCKVRQDKLIKPNLINYLMTQHKNLMEHIFLWITSYRSNEHISTFITKLFFVYTLLNYLKFKEYVIPNQLKFFSRTLC
jgi:hypothetical protein